MQTMDSSGPENEDWFKDGVIEPGGRMPLNTSGGSCQKAYFGFDSTFGGGHATAALRDRQLGPKTKTKEPEFILCER
jgi:hypothetical protein